MPNEEKSQAKTFLKHWEERYVASLANLKKLVEDHKEEQDPVRKGHRKSAVKKAYKQANKASRRIRKWKKIVQK